ncbi:FAD-dependent oxidoreductase [Amycolatopsis sp. CA-126428]|uniref:FAD-dependent oxidoreductase n=1 Tax=Amycolatopsis sp. CA-126428 TaxID=2073158 RepID=UPI000CD07667|nr:NAD(P)/FAD-dependent oxidoreductase [Amycolatopsis sp. CA-126428]
MTTHTPVKAIIAGAGIGGLTAAATLRQVGIEVEIYERAKELKPAGGALSLMSNAVLALRTLGLDPDFGAHAAILADLHFVTTRGKPIKTLRFRELTERLGAHSYGIHRTDLQRVLLDAVADTPIALDAAATGFDADDDGVTLHLADGRSVRGDLLVGADGFDSAVRRGLVGPESPREPGCVCWFATPVHTDPKFPHAYGAHYWGSGKRFGVANIGSGRIYWWGTKNVPPSVARGWRGCRDDVLETFAGWAPEIARVIEATAEDEILVVPARDRPFLERWGRGRVTLLGDAAHPVLASLGQGAGLAMEDAAVLAHHLAGADDVVTALRGYEDERRPRTRRMVELAYAMSKMEQWEGPLRVALRNAYFRCLPRAAIDRRNRSLLEFTTTKVFRPEAGSPKA